MGGKTKGNQWRVEGNEEVRSRCFTVVKENEGVLSKKDGKATAERWFHSEMKGRDRERCHFQRKHNNLFILFLKARRGRRRWRRRNGWEETRAHGGAQQHLKVITHPWGILAPLIVFLLLPLYILTSSLNLFLPPSLSPWPCFSQFLLLLHFSIR